jgi:hypothetical protein
VREVCSLLTHETPREAGCRSSRKKGRRMLVSRVIMSFHRLRSAIASLDSGPEALDSRRCAGSTTDM